MNLSFTALITVGLALGVIAAKGKSSEPESVVLSAAKADVRPGEERFVLRLAGNLRCEIARSEAASNGVYTLRAGSECEHLLPGLSEVRFWQEHVDGSVVLGRNLADDLVSFAVADGVAYESFKPASALISLTAED